VYPTVAEYLLAEVKGDAPPFSTARRMAIEDMSTADLKAKHLLANAAPLSLKASDEDPPLGKARDTVEVEEPSSVTTINPLGSLVMSVLPALEGVGVVLGILQDKS